MPERPAPRLLPVGLAPLADLGHARKMEFGESPREALEVISRGGIDLEHAAPEDLARTPEAISMVRRLVERVRPTYRKQTSALAARLGVS